MPTMSPVRGCRVVAGLAAALVAATLVAPTVAQARPLPGSDGIGDAYFPQDGNGGINVLRYRIEDRYQFRGARLSGRTVLKIRATHDLSQFNLDFLLPVRRVTVDGRPAAHTQPGSPELVITPQRSIKQGDRFKVEVKYAGRPRRTSYLGETNWLADRHEVVAMNQPHMATWWFPANDHPSDKARMDISITVPRGKQVFANGQRISIERDGRLATHRWRADEPMSTYLAMFAAGDFRVASGESHGLPWRAIVSKQLSSGVLRDNMALMRQTPEVVAGLEADLGDYPFSTVGGLVTALDVRFALENQTLPTYPVTGRDYTWLVVHELAHQWFGDSVALRRWSDIWLNEGAATFMEVRWTETHGGQSGAAWLRREYDKRPEGRTFWELKIGDPGPDSIFATPVYERGAMTFQALRNVIGENAFWTVMQRWVREHANGLGSRAEFEELAEQVSGVDLERFFRVWLDRGRKPADTLANGLGEIETG